jgi:hypothetical protein
MQKWTDDEFSAAWRDCGGVPNAVAKQLGLTYRSVMKRRAALGKKGVFLNTNKQGNAGVTGGEWQNIGRAYRRENQFNIDEGHVIIFSDAHWWPDQPKTASHEALLALIKVLRPVVLVANGDIFDGARVSRHEPLGWSALPSVKEEIEICEDHLHELHLAADPKRCNFFWNVGNHDARFDRKLAAQASEYEGVIPRLEDKFPRWNFAWSLMLNDHVMIKHRYHNGIHATYNNTLKSGKSIVTGHLHRLAVTPWADYNGRRWGVDTGTLSDPLAPQFDYGENNPTPHTSGFAVLTFRDGRMCPPELVEVLDGKAYFRGSVVS